MSKLVCISGGAGFVAHHVIDYLLGATDWEFITLDRLDFSGNLNRLADVVHGRPNETQQRVRTIFHDLKAPISELNANFIGKPDIILHLAAASHVDRSISHPMEFVHDNVVGTAHILEYARTLPNLECFWYFGTDEVFGPAPPGVNYTERARYNSTNVYSATKAAGEELAVAYRNTYQVPVIISHAMNIFGERQTPEKFIPLCIKKVFLDETVFIHADKSKTKAGSRFYIHAQDVADAMHFILTENPRSADDYGGATCPKFNIVGKEEVDNLTLAKMIAAAQGKELKYEMVDFHTSRPGHDLRYSLDGGLLKYQGWEPKLSLSTRIKAVSDWYLENKAWLGL